MARLFSRHFHVLEHSVHNNAIKATSKKFRLTSKKTLTFRSAESSTMTVDVILEIMERQPCIQMWANRMELKTFGHVKFVC